MEKRDLISKIAQRLSEVSLFGNSYERQAELLLETLVTAGVTLPEDQTKPPQDRISPLIKKVVRNGKVAVLYTPKYGAGWFTIGAREELIFDPDIVSLVENEEREKIRKVLEVRGYDFYTGGARDLSIEWVLVGHSFKIRGHDGKEVIEYPDTDDWVIA
jgi:hypothetical protein